jgi:predicted cobalt transporter CbtA
MDAARLGSRQGWWVLAAGSAALACAVAGHAAQPLALGGCGGLAGAALCRGRTPHRGRPAGRFQPEAQAALRQLGTQFIWATTWVSLSFWVSLGVAGGLAFQRWVRPALLAVLQRSAAPAAGAVQAPQ